jgi:ATP-binding cassette subfamily B protein
LLLDILSPGLILVMPSLNGQSTINKYKSGKKNSTLTVLIRIWGHLSPRRRRQLPVLAILMLLSGLAEAMTLGAVLPFLAVIVAPEKIFDNPFISQSAMAFGFTDPHDLVLPLTIIFALVAIIAGGLRLLVLWCNNNYSQWVGHDLSVEIYRRTLYQPYQVHASCNTSELISSIEKTTLVIQALMSLLMLTSSTVLVVGIVLALIAMDPFIAVVAFLGFSAIYGLIVTFARQKLARNSAIISSHLTLRIKILQEGLGAIRDVILDNSQEFYSQQYRQINRPYCRAKIQNGFTAGSPRYVMEALGMVLIAILALGLRLRPGGEALVFPLLGTFALGTQRLLPALQQIFAAWATLMGDKSSIDDVLELLDQPLPEEITVVNYTPLVWNSSIKMRGVGFHYDKAGPWVLKDVSLTIPKGYRVGFVGTTGSGKSTTVDLLMGLLQPTLGEVLVDGIPLQGEYGRAWQRTIAHVPQHIYLADTTIAENIALGVPAEEIDLDRVRRAALQAQIADFVEQMPDGYWSALGERGIRLSGGQRQRLGIARALYKNASVLVFDEATSALDNTTEQEVMKAINSLADDLTVIMIAHRLSTVERCDLIIELSRGKVVAQGTYQELLASSASFCQMVRSVS